MKISDEKVRDYRDLLWCKTAVFRGERLLTYTWIITKMNHDQRYLILSNVYGDMIYTLVLTLQRGYSWEFLFGVCYLVLQILILFQTKKWHFPHPFSDQISRICTHFQAWPNFACSRLSDSGRDAPVSSCFIFTFVLSQFSRPNYLRAWNRPLPNLN